MRYHYKYQELLEENRSGGLGQLKTLMNAEFQINQIFPQPGEVLILWGGAGSGKSTLGAQLGSFLNASFGYPIDYICVQPNNIRSRVYSRTPFCRADIINLENVETAQLSSSGDGVTIVEVAGYTISDHFEAVQTLFSSDLVYNLFVLSAAKKVRDYDEPSVGKVDGVALTHLDVGSWTNELLISIVTANLPISYLNFGKVEEFKLEPATEKRLNQLVFSME